MTSTPDSGNVITFPSVEDYLKPKLAPVLPKLTGPELRYLAALDELGGGFPRMRDLERALGLRETRVRDLRDALVAKGVLVQLTRADGSPVAGRYGRPGASPRAGDTEPDGSEEPAPVGTTA